MTNNVFGGTLNPAHRIHRVRDGETATRLTERGKELIPETR